MSLAALSCVTVNWQASENPDATGYNVYYGTTSRAYTAMVDAGNNLSLTLTGLTTGTTYFFAVTTYDDQGDESGYSSEVAYQAIDPTVATLTTANYSSSSFAFTLTGLAGSNYVVQESSILTEWFPVQTNSAPFFFQDTNIAPSGQRFYRALYASP